MGVAHFCAHCTISNTQNRLFHTYVVLQNTLSSSALVCCNAILFCALGIFRKRMLQNEDKQWSYKRSCKYYVTRKCRLFWPPHPKECYITVPYTNKKFCYCRGTARRTTSVEILWSFLTELLTRSSVSEEERNMRAHCQLTSCKMLHKCSMDCIWNRLQAVNDL